MTTDSLLEIDDPELEDAIIEVVKGEIALIRTSTPGVVRSYDPTTNTVEVQPVIRGRFVNEDEDRVETYLPDPVANIPVFVLGAGGGVVSFNVQKGDVVQLIVSDRSIAEWKTATTEDITPDDMRRFNLGDSIAYPSVKSVAAALRGKTVFGENTALGARVVCGGNRVAIGANNIEALDQIKKALDENLATQQGLSAIFAAITTAAGINPATPVTTGTLLGFWNAGLNPVSLATSIAKNIAAINLLNSIRGDL